MLIIGQISVATCFQIIEKDWHKRRSPTTKLLNPVSVAIPDYQAEKNHICKMLVSYDDGSVKELIGRVIYNQINQYWTVDGMEVAVKVIEQ